MAASRQARIEKWIVCRDGVAETSCPTAEVAKAYIDSVHNALEAAGTPIPVFTIEKRVGEALVRLGPTAWERLLREPPF